MTDHHNFESFMVWTTQTGGKMSVCWASADVYEEAKSTGRLNIAPDEREPTWVDLKMVSFARLDELHDFAKPKP